VRSSNSPYLRCARAAIENAVRSTYNTINAAAERTIWSWEGARLSTFNEATVGKRRKTRIGAKQLIPRGVTAWFARFLPSPSHNAQAARRNRPTSCHCARFSRGSTSERLALICLRITRCRLGRHRVSSRAGCTRSGAPRGQHDDTKTNNTPSVFHETKPPFNPSQRIFRSCGHTDVYQTWRARAIRRRFSWPRRHLRDVRRSRPNKEGGLPGFRAGRDSAVESALATDGHGLTARDKGAIGRLAGFAVLVDPVPAPSDFSARAPRRRPGLPQKVRNVPPLKLLTP
jgi:hypothetical protein